MCLIIIVWAQEMIIIRENLLVYPVFLLCDSYAYFPCNKEVDYNRNHLAVATIVL